MGEGLDWIDVAEETEMWRALEKSVIQFRIP